ncbi:F-box only protein 7-like isoform X2 [Ruditapes philippinarum]|uniref:F-box only protein 7-like isoform X2 n=1 Tax=Ruditapes philippinarum TaxID=129788 RepID=UPI00295B65D8|nr:F-box only protein 7-like isoform X2 [Ruditapes philippinarum]
MSRAETPSVFWGRNDLRPNESKSLILAAKSEMKLRLRLDKISKVIDISDEISEDLTVDDLSERALNVFQDCLYGEYFLSLNKKDALNGQLKVKGDCDIATATDAKGNTVETASKINFGEKKIDENKSSGNNAQSAMPIDTGRPGTSAECSMEPETDASYDVAMETEEETVDHVVVKQCLSEPVLCREAVNGTVPALLQEIYTCLEPRDMAESLCIALHVLMLETGFIVYTEQDEIGVSQLPVEWRYSGYFKFSYTYPGCADTSCCITVITTGNSVIVHGKVLGSNDATRQCSLKPADYVKTVGTDCTKCYCQLAKLSMLFKDAIANPLVHDIRTAAGLEDVFGLLALTQEIKLRILSFLDLRSLLKVSCVNTELLEISKDPYLWRCLYLRNFGNRRDNSLSQNWKELYKREYKSRKERRKAMNRMKIVTPRYWGPANPFSGPSNWIPPGPGGIIGGDYDLYPSFPGNLPGVPGRMGPRPPSLPRPRYDLIGPGPDIDPGPDPGFIPRRPGPGRGGGRGNNPFSGFGGFGPRFF